MTLKLGRNRSLFILLVTFLLSSLMIAKSYALPFDVTIIPNAPLPTAVVAGLTTPASYLVINNTAEERNNVYVKYLPPNVSVAPGGCGNVFTLAATGQPGDSCVLNLTVSGAVNGNDPNPHQHLFICLPGGLTCAGTNYPLNVASIATSSIALTPANVSLSTTRTQQFQAIATFSNGTTQNITPFATWASSNTAVASVNSAGLATALTVGTTNITATMNGVTSAAATLTVTTPSLAITPVTATIGSGQTQQYTAIATFSDGSMTNVSNLAAWNSSSTSIATISATGLATGITLGSTNITAMYQGATSNTAVLTVLPSFVSVGQATQSSNFAIGYFSNNGGQTFTASSSFPIAPVGANYLLASVACDISKQNCLAAGSITLTSVPQALIYLTTNGGIAWTAVSPSSVAGTNGNTLSGIACGSNAQSCTAVGTYNNGTYNLPLTFYTTSNILSGGTWAPSTIQPLPIPTVSTNNVLNAVACDTTGRICTTVGYYFNSTLSTPSNVPLTYLSINGGKTWVSTSTLPPQYVTTGMSPVTSTDNELTGVACGNTGLRCSTVGFANVSGTYIPISYTSGDGGNTWSLSSVIPPPQSSGNNQLYAVACDNTPTNCVAVGNYIITGSSTTLPLTYFSTNGGTTWSASITLPTPVTGATAHQITGVSCERTQGLICVAVGSYSTASITNNPIAYYSIDGGMNWSTPVFPTSPSTNAQLNGVS